VFARSEPRSDAAGKDKTALDGPDALTLGSYPTPLRRLDGIPGAQHELWLKDDGVSALPYGGNKVRKLERLLALAQRSGAQRLLTVGAAGSHHVLATCVFGQHFGLSTHAVLTPQPWTPHAEETLRAGLNAGLSAVSAASYLDALRKLRGERRGTDYVIGPGGFGAAGTWAYRLAVDELSEQLTRAGVGRPLDAILVAAGSGSTAAGLLAGCIETGVARRVIAVQVTQNPLLRSMIVGQASHASWQHQRSLRTWAALGALEIDGRFIGEGYGHASSAGDAATELARSFGLQLEPTYTAKAFAAALQRARAEDHDSARRKLRLRGQRTYLYWHTLSSAPLLTLLQGAPETLPAHLARLLRRPTA
jgi:D-cysteine desulfhydrase